MNHNHQPSISDIRARLRQNSGDRMQDDNQAYIREQNRSIFTPETPGVVRHRSFSQKLREGDTPGWLKFWQNHWMLILSGLAFFFPAYLIFAPDYLLPGGQGVEVGSINPFMFAAITGTAFAVVSFLVLNKFRGMADGLHNMRRIGRKSPAFKIGAVLGIAVFFYRFYNPILGEFLPEPPSITNFNTMDAVKLLAHAGLGGFILQRLYNMIMGEEDEEA